MSDELLLQSAFPVIEGIPDQLYAETVEREFKDYLPPEKNLSYITTCEKVKRDFLEDFQHEFLNGISEFGYPYKKLSDPEKIKVDRWVGKFLYEKMNITPTVAATLGMWQFINLYMFPSVVYWRWGDVKDRFLGIRRNYFGTQWWRHYFFTAKNETSREYMFMIEDEIVSIYERSGTRGLPNQVDNNVLWYRKLCAKYQAEHKIPARLYKEVIKVYNAELGYRNYFALNQEDLFSIYEQSFVSCLGMDIKDEEIEQDTEDDNSEVSSIPVIESKDNEETEKVIPVIKEEKSSEEPIKKKIYVVKQEKGSDLTKKKVVVVKKNTSSLLNAEKTLDSPVQVKKEKTSFIFADETVMILRNDEKKGIEIIFETSPREITKFRIKQAGFKYLSTEKKWWASDSESVLTSLKEIFNFK